MGKCLSKQSKKAKDGEDPDRAPYTRSSQSPNKSEPIPIAGKAPGAKQANETRKGDAKNINDWGRQIPQDEKQKTKDEPETVWVKADGSPDKEVKPIQKSSKSPPRDVSAQEPVQKEVKPIQKSCKSPPRDVSAQEPVQKEVKPIQKSSRSPPRDMSVQKPVQSKDIEIKLDKKGEDKPEKDGKQAEDKPGAEIKSFSSSRTTSSYSRSSGDGPSKSFLHTTTTNKTSVCDSPLALRDSKTFSGDPRTDTSLFSKTAPTAIDKNDLGVMSVKEIRSQRTSKIETKTETQIKTAESGSEEQPMALLGALKYLKPSDEDGSGLPENISSSVSVKSSSQTTVTTTKLNGEITSQTVFEAEVSPKSTNTETSVKTLGRVPDDALTTKIPPKHEPTKIQSSVEETSLLSTQMNKVSPMKDKGDVGLDVTVKSSIPEAVVEVQSLVLDHDTVQTSEKKPTEDLAVDSNITASANKASTIPVKPVVIYSHKSNDASSDLTPTQPENGSLSEMSKMNVQAGSAVIDSVEVQEEQPEPFQNEAEKPVPVKNIMEDYKNMFVDFSQYNHNITTKHDLIQNTRIKPLKQIDNWFNSDSEGRVAKVIGATGVGKTCLAAELCRVYSSRLAASHFFRYNSPNVFHNRLQDVLISFAYQFCDVFPNYFSLLPKVGKLKDLIKKGDLPELYNALLFYPFTDSSLERNGEENMLILIDALDECDPQDVGVLTDVINNLNESCPQWLSVLVTCRADGKIADQLINIEKVELKRKDPENMSDVKRYLKEPLGLFMDRISLDGGLTTLTKKTQGSFTCAQIYKNRLSNRPSDSKIALREVTTLYPDGMEQNLQDILKAYKERISFDKELKNAYGMITSVLASAREPISLDFIFDIVGAKYFELCKEAVKEELEPLLNIDGEKVEFLNLCIVEWLFDTKAGTFKLDMEIGRQELASLCTKWITGIIDGDLELDPSLKAYALKHSLFHLTDVRGNTEPIGKLLCSLRYAREKLGLPGINLNHLLDDYEHRHIQNGSEKEITVRDYMKKYPQIWEQISLSEKFIRDKEDKIRSCPKFVLHIAANYSRLERIQQNAKAELESEPWLEDLTAVPVTHCVVKNLGGSIRAVDVSSDGKTIAAVVKHEDGNVKLHILNGQSGEDIIKSVDIKSLNDRVGMLAKFMIDGNNIFVGSLTTLISKQGKQVPSGLDSTTVDLKEKYSIECCDVSARYFGFGLTTFPWGGRSLHLSVFDLKTKKCMKTIEILRFRFGGSGQFCIKSVGIAKERPLICACVKQSAKPQLRVIVWNITKFQVVNSIDINNDDVSKSIFVADHTLLLGAGLKSSSSSKSNVHVMSEYWNFKEVTNKSSHPWDASEQHSLFASHENTTIACRWYGADGNAILEQWQGDDIKSKPFARHTIRGLNEVSEMQIAADVILFVSGEDINLYNAGDLESLDVTDSSRIPNISELMVDSLVFLPKSDTAVITSKKDCHYTVYLCDLSQTDPTLVPTPFDKITPANCKSIDSLSPRSIFTGPTACTERCFSSADGNYLFFNSGDHIKVLDQAHNNSKNIPNLKDLNESSVYNEYNAVKATASMKDNFLAVVYGQIPNKVFLYDVRSCNLLRKISLDVKTGQSGVVSDFTFMPATGYLLTYHHDEDNAFAAWNSRTGDQLSQISLVVAYAKPSPALDRFVVNIKNGKNEGVLLLRNADNKFCKTLPMGDNVWLADNKKSDVEFSSDGTILVGVCALTGFSRVWNAANGEALQDLPTMFNGHADVVGMLTNTHVLFQDDRLQAMDVASGELIAVLPLEYQLEGRFTSRGLRISTKGSVVSGATSSGTLSVFLCHNFTTVKRKTTLQRMKSFRK